MVLPMKVSVLAKPEERKHARLAKATILLKGCRRQASSWLAFFRLCGMNITLGDAGTINLHARIITMAARCDICGKEKALRPERLACQQQDKAGVPRESQARARKGTRKGGQLQGLHTLHQGLQDRKAVALKKTTTQKGAYLGS